MVAVPVLLAEIPVMVMVVVAALKFVVEIRFMVLWNYSLWSQ